MGDATGQRLALQRFARFIKSVMASRNLSQQQIAAQLGMSQSYVSKILRGAGKDVTAGWIARARARYGVHPMYFFDPDIPSNMPWEEYHPRRDPEIVALQRQVVLLTERFDKTDKDYRRIRKSS